MTDARLRPPAPSPPAGALLACALAAALCSAGAAAGAGEAFPGGLAWNAVVQKAEAEAAAIRQNGPGPWTIARGSFAMDSGMPGEPVVTCHYAVPEAPKNAPPSPRREDVVYYFHTPNPGSRDILEDETCSRLVAESGMTVFGIAFQDSSQMSYYHNAEQRDRYYAFAKSGSFAAVLAASRKLRELLRLPERRLFLTGYSAGGIATQRFAEEYPDACDGVVTVNGHTFVQKGHARCPMLIIHTLGDGGVGQGDGLAAYYRSLDAPCIRVLLNPAWGGLSNGNAWTFHGRNPMTTVLSLRFFEALADLRRAKPRTPLSQAAAWPYAAARERPDVVAAMGAGWRAPFQAAALTPVPIPSARFYAQFLELPPPTRRIEVPRAGTVLAARPGAARTAAGLVVIWNPSPAAWDAGTDGEGIPQALDLDLQFAAERGLLAVAPSQAGALGAVVQAVSAGARLARKAPLSAVLFDPGREALSAFTALPGIGGAIVVLKDTTDLPPLLPVLATCLDNRVFLRVLVSTDTQDGYESFLKPINPALRAKLFLPFRPRGPDPALSLHQQQLETAIGMILARSGGGAP